MNLTHVLVTKLMVEALDDKGKPTTVVLHEHHAGSDGEPTVPTWATWERRSFQSEAEDIEEEVVGHVVDHAGTVVPLVRRKAYGFQLDEVTRPAGLSDNGLQVVVATYREVPLDKLGASVPRYEFLDEDKGGPPEEKSFPPVWE